MLKNNRIPCYAIDTFPAFVNKIIKPVNVEDVLNYDLINDEFLNKRTTLIRESNQDIKEYYRDFPEDIVQVMGFNPFNIAVEVINVKINAEDRNRVMGEVINNLFKEYDRIAFVGGVFHLLHDCEEMIGFSEDKILSDFIKADEKEIIELYAYRRRL